MDRELDGCLRCAGEVDKHILFGDEVGVESTFHDYGWAEVD